MSQNPQTVIGIPGQWKDGSDIVASIARRSGGYLFAGMILKKLDSEDLFKLEIYQHDPNLRKAFSIAGRGQLTDADLEAIDLHTYTLYLIANGGSIETAKKLLHAANALLKSGGLAVKIESAGTAHRSDQWSGFCDQDDLRSLLKAYVVYIGNRGIYYSCGMHNLGYPDAIVEAEISAGDAALLLHTFLLYLLIEQPRLGDGQTFSIEADAPRYQLTHEACARYPKDDLFHNPFGMWKLVPR